MAAGNVARIIRGPGKLVVDPTDLSAADPYGGTEVGLVNQCALTPLGTSLRIENEGLGEATDILHPTNRWIFSCFLRGWDDDAVDQFFRGYSCPGTTTQHGVFEAPGIRLPGQSMINFANVALLFVPENPKDTNAILIYRGIPLWSEDAEMAFDKREEFGIPLVVDCLRDNSNQILQIGRLADLSLI